MPDFDTEWTDYPVCPHCGCKDEDWWDGTSMRNDGDTDEFSCGNCEADYAVTLSTSVSFKTKKIEAESS